MTDTHDTRHAEWFSALGDIWIRKDSGRIATLMAPSFRYHEEPFSDPITSVEELVSMWKEVEDQDLQGLNIHFLGVAGEAGIATWDCKIAGKDGPIEMSGVYLVSLDESGRCTLFRQWWNERGAD